MPVYDFETYVRGERPGPDKAMVTINKHGTLSMNRKAYSLLGEPKTVLLRYAEKHQVVGVRPTEASDTNAFKVRQDGDSKNVSVAFGSFATFYKIDRTETRRYMAEMVDGTLVIDLTKPMGLVIQARGPNAEN